MYFDFIILHFIHHFHVAKKGMHNKLFLLYYLIW
jgi:hypothetical protein